MGTITFPSGTARLAGERGSKLRPSSRGDRLSLTALRALAPSTTLTPSGATAWARLRVLIPPAAAGLAFALAAAVLLLRHVWALSV